MDRMLVVVFDNEAKAYEGKTALQDLTAEGSIRLYGYAVIARKSDGTASIKQSDNNGPLGSVFGMSLGALIGALFGPAGLALGAAAGLGSGAALDFTNLGVGQDYIDDVSKALLPGKVALVAEIDEEWTTPVDTRMEPLGGVIFRRALSDVQHQVHEENLAAMKADLAQFKAEQAQAHADRKAKLQEKINHLDSRIQAEFQKGKQRREAAELKAQAKAKVLEVKAAAATAKTA
jgi:uncharacterized membrane protein